MNPVVNSSIHPTVTDGADGAAAILTGRVPMPAGTGARIFLAIPFYKLMDGECVDSWDNGVKPGSPNMYFKYFCGDAFLARCFNALWCMALNKRHRRISHFAMIHTDVMPDNWFLDTMVEEMTKHGADLLSVVLPIKSQHGLTSTAVRCRETGHIKRLTMKEVLGGYDYVDSQGAHCYGITLPQTFDGDDVARVLSLDGKWDLLASTGLWIAKFTDNWIEKVYFEVRDKILRADGSQPGKAVGEFYPETAVDDWLFSIKLHKLGLRVVATKAVGCGHWGKVQFRNDAVWGTLDADDRVGRYDWLGEEDMPLERDEKDLSIDLGGK